MTFDEFVEKYGDGDDDAVYNKISKENQIIFWRDGEVIIKHNYNGIIIRLPLAYNRTPAQMEQVLISLTEEKTND